MVLNSYARYVAYDGSFSLAANVIALASPRLYDFKLDPNHRIAALSVSQSGNSKAVLRGRISIKWENPTESECIGDKITQESNEREIEPQFFPSMGHLLFQSPNRQFQDKVEITITISLQSTTKLPNFTSAPMI